MKIIIIFNEQIHFGLAAKERVLNYAKSMKYYGFEVKILMPFGFQPFSGELIKKNGIIESIDYEYTTFFKIHPKKNKFFPFNLFWFYFKKLFTVFTFHLNILTKKKDVIWIYSCSNLDVILLRILNPRARILLELCEIPFHNIENKFLKEFYRNIRIKYLLFCYDYLIVISKNLLGYIQKQKITTKTFLIPVLYNFNETNSKINQFSENLFKNNFRIVHTGSLTEHKDGILTIINAIGELKRRFLIEIDFYSTGKIENSNVFNQVQNLIKNFEIDNQIKFLGYLSKDDLFELQKTSDLFIIYKIDNEQNRFNFPSKIAEYMALGKPVLTTNVGEAPLRFIDDENIFILQDFGVDALVLKLLFLYNNTELMRKVGINGKNVAYLNFDSILNLKLLSEEIKLNLN
ncbi:MAG: glycosyltransferase [Bacteroidia bacterium]|nr:glycosyltransferase [Bacteroidia bacterium]